MNSIRQTEASLIETIYTNSMEWLKSDENTVAKIGAGILIVAAFILVIVIVRRRAQKVDRKKIAKPQPREEDVPQGGNARRRHNKRPRSTPENIVERRPESIPENRETREEI